MGIYLLIQTLTEDITDWEQCVHSKNRTTNDCLTFRCVNEFMLEIDSLVYLLAHFSPS